MKRLGLVKAATLQPFVRFLDANGIQLKPHFHAAHIAPELIGAEDSWLPKQQVYTFLSDVAHTHRLEALGLMVGDQICVADLGPIGRDLYQCSTLADCCRHFVELVPRFAEGNSGRLDVGETTTWFGYRTTDHRRGNRDHADHYGLMMFLSVIRLVAGYWVPREITIQTGPCGAFSEHPAWNQTHVTVNAENTTLAFPSAWLNRPIPPPPETSRTAHADGLGNTDPPATLSETLMLVLASYLHIGGAPSIERVADSLNLSTRTLKRRLAEEGETYSGLVEWVRMRSAVTLLEDPTKSVNEIAYILGYSGANNFIRAFRRNTERSPQQWRAEHETANTARTTRRSARGRGTADEISASIGEGRKLIAPKP